MTLPLLGPMTLTGFDHPWFFLFLIAVLGLAGLYLVYYWSRLHFGDTATIADDPIVSFGVRFSGRLRRLADSGGSGVVAGAAAVVVLAAAGGLWQRRQARG